MPRIEFTASTTGPLTPTALMDIGNLLGNLRSALAGHGTPMEDEPIIACTADELTASFDIVL